MGALTPQPADEETEPPGRSDWAGKVPQLCEGRAGTWSSTRPPKLYPLSHPSQFSLCTTGSRRQKSHKVFASLQGLDLSFLGLYWVLAEKRKFSLPPSLITAHCRAAQPGWLRAIFPLTIPLSPGLPPQKTQSTPLLLVLLVQAQLRACASLRAGLGPHPPGLLRCGSPGLKKARDKFLKDIGQVLLSWSQDHITTLMIN